MNRFLLSVFLVLSLAACSTASPPDGYTPPQPVAPTLPGPDEEPTVPEEPTSPTPPSEPTAPPVEPTEPAPPTEPTVPEEPGEEPTEPPEPTVPEEPSEPEEPDVEPPPPATGEPELTLAVTESEFDEGTREIVVVGELVNTGTAPASDIEVFGPEEAWVYDDEYYVGSEGSKELLPGDTGFFYLRLKSSDGSVPTLTTSYKTGPSNLDTIDVSFGYTAYEEDEYEYELTFVNSKTSTAYNVTANFVCPQYGTASSLTMTPVDEFIIPGAQSTRTFVWNVPDCEVIHAYAQYE